MKKHLITIAGNNGSGKSTTSKKIANTLGYTHKSTGDFMRSIALEKGVTLQELGSIAEKDPTIDKMLDDSNLEIGKMDNVVLDSRLGFYFIPDSFKVFLKCDSKIAATRFLKSAVENPDRLNENLSKSEDVSDIARSFDIRLESEKKRYDDLYGIKDHTDTSNFDLVIDTSLPENSKERVPQIIIEVYNQWLNK
ncbi:MAG: AAA family ATPase [Candidatus Paceibacterota bacterium]